MKATKNCFNIGLRTLSRRNLAISRLRSRTKCFLPCSIREWPNIKEVLGEVSKEEQQILPLCHGSKRPAGILCELTSSAHETLIHLLEFV